VRTFGMEGIGVYRTELQFLAEKSRPERRFAGGSCYRQVIEAQQRPAGVVPPARRRWRRRIERRDSAARNATRRWASAACAACSPTRTCCACSCGRSCARRQGPSERRRCWCRSSPSSPSLQRVKAALLEERVALKKARLAVRREHGDGAGHRGPGGGDVARRAAQRERLRGRVAVDDLQAHLLGADRDNAAVREYHEMVHPAVFEMLARMAKDAERREKRWCCSARARPTRAHAVLPRRRLPQLLDRAGASAQRAAVIGALLGRGVPPHRGAHPRGAAHARRAEGARQSRRAVGARSFVSVTVTTYEPPLLIARSNRRKPFASRACRVPRCSSASMSISGANSCRSAM
jgi:hypothetical protein